MAVSTSVAKYNLLNPTERALAERVYGAGQAFVDAMNMFAEAGIQEARIYILNPEYVPRKLEEVQKQDSNVGGLGRASGLNGFDNNSYFCALDRLVLFRGAVRGVRRASEANVPK